jgi:hypothetical protein
VCEARRGPNRAAASYVISPWFVEDAFSGKRSAINTNKWQLWHDMSLVFDATSMNLQYRRLRHLRNVFKLCGHATCIGTTHIAVARRLLIGMVYRKATWRRMDIGCLALPPSPCMFMELWTMTKSLLELDAKLITPAATPQPLPSALIPLTFSLHLSPGLCNKAA